MPDLADPETGSPLTDYQAYVNCVKKFISLAVLGKLSGAYQKPQCHLQSDPDDKLKQKLQQLTMCCYIFPLQTTLKAQHSLTLQMCARPWRLMIPC